MAHRFAELAFTDAVRAVQEEMGSRPIYARMDEGELDHDRLTENEIAFLGARDSFYMATVSETGWPYVQHRGGPQGFVRVLDEKTIGFADFRGNRQYVSVGNLRGDDRVSLFFMDYPQKVRLKLLGRARAVDPSDTETLGRLVVPGYRAKVERGMLITVEAYDWNCPQHITRRYTEAHIAHAIQPLHDRIADLESRLRAAGLEVPEEG